MKGNPLIEANHIVPRPSPGSSANVQTLALAGREKQRADRVRALTLVFALMSMGLLTPAVLDYHYFWDAHVRYLISSICWLNVLLGVAVVIIHWRRRAGTKTVALDLERRLAMPHCEVSTAAQYVEKSVTGPDGISGELNQALQRRAAIHLQNAGSPYHTPLRIWASLLAVGIIAAALLLMLSSACRIAVQRIMFPWTRSQYTNVEVRPGDSEVAAKSDLVIAARFFGRLPTQAEVEWTGANGIFKTDRLAQTGADSFSYKFKDVRGNFTYRVRGNDGLTADYHARIYAPPEIASMDVEVIPPAYAHIPSSHSTGGHVTALRGSELRWRLFSSLPLAKAEFSIKDGAPNLSLNAENPRTWLGTMILKKDMVYHVALSDLEGHANRPNDGFRLVALPDAPPVVEILAPEPNITAAPQDKIAINIQAEDDIGLAEVRLVSQKPGSLPRSILISPGDKVGRHFRGDFTLDLAPMNLQPDDIVMFYAEARDNNIYDGPGITRSSVHFITIIDSDQPAADSGGGGQAEEINLMQLQRDLISATARLSESASRETKADLATSQHEINGYAEIFLETMQAMGAPQQAVASMSAAIENMNQSEKKLNAGEAIPALDPEGQALANMSHVALLSQPGRPGRSKLVIALEKIRKARAEKQQQAQDVISASLAKALALLKGQQALQQGESGDGQAQYKSPDENQRDGKNEDSPTESSGKPADLNSELSREQLALAEQARDLAEHLSHAADDNPRLSHQLGSDANFAAAQMSAAAEIIHNGDLPDSHHVIDAQHRSIEALTRIIHSLTQLSAKMTEKSDVEEESAPPEYSEQLSRYYQKLSHEK